MLSQTWSSSGCNTPGYDQDSNTLIPEFWSKFAHLQNVCYTNVKLSGQDEALGVAADGVRILQRRPAKQSDPFSSELVQHTVLAGSSDSHCICVCADY